MTGFFMYPLFLLTTALLIFWVFQKVMWLVNYRHDCETKRLQNELLQNECALKLEIANLHRVRTVLLLRENDFTDDERDELEARGLSSYLGGK